MQTGSTSGLSEKSAESDGQKNFSEPPQTEKNFLKPPQRVATEEEEAQLQAYKEDLRAYLKARNHEKVFAQAPLVLPNSRFVSPAEMLRIVRQALVSEDRYLRQAALEEMLSRKI
jgi:hypothetical protein